MFPFEQSKRRSQSYRWVRNKNTKTLQHEQNNWQDREEGSSCVIWGNDKTDERMNECKWSERRRRRKSLPRLKEIHEDSFITTSLVSGNLYPFFLFIQLCLCCPGIFSVYIFACRLFFQSIAMTFSLLRFLLIEKKKMLRLFCLCLQHLIPPLVLCWRSKKFFFTSYS